MSHVSVLLLEDVLIVFDMWEFYIFLFWKYLEILDRISKSCFTIKGYIIVPLKVNHQDKYYL